MPTVEYPNWRPQREFLSAVVEKDPKYTAIGYGGARGGGKSHATGEAHVLAAIHYPRVRTLILRKGTEDVIGNYKDQIEAFMQAIGINLAFKYNVKSSYFRGLNGSTIRLGFINKPADYGRYLGHEYALISLTEASEHDEARWQDMGSSNRAGLSDMIPRITLDTNPGGIGNEWITKRFVNPETRWPKHLWIPANIWDCPSTIIKNPNYIRENLWTLPDWQRKQWLFGRFDAMAGQYFIIPPWLILESIPAAIVENRDPSKISIPRWATWYAGVDYGDAKPFAVIYVAKWKDLWTNKEHVHIVKEIYEANLDPDEQAGRVHEAEDDLRQRGLLHGTVTYYADPSVARRIAVEREAQSRNIAKMWRDYGFYTRPASSNNRIGGWKLMKMLYRHGVLTIDPACKAFLNESNLAVANGSPGPPIDEDIKQATNIADHCLIAETLVTTRNGDRPISEVIVGDEVLTRKGWNRVLKSSMTFSDAEVFKVRLSNGNELVGTGNHPVYIPGKGFIRLDSLRYGDVLYSKEDLLCKASLLSSTVSHSDGIQSPNDGLIDCTSGQMRPISRPELATCTKRFGSRIMEMFQRNTISTIKTVIHSITTLRTLKRLVQNSISNFTVRRNDLKRYGNTTIELGRLQKSGTHLQKVLSGIANTLLNVTSAIRPMELATVNIAGKSLKLKLQPQPVVQMPAKQRCVESQELTTSCASALSAETYLQLTSIPKTKLVPVSVVQLISAGRASVYDLTVENQPEFFANGVLVHNSLDAARYCLLSIYPKGFKVPQAESKDELERYLSRLPEGVR